MTSVKPPTQVEELQKQLDSETPYVSVDSHKLIEENNNYMSIVNHYKKNLLKNIDLEKIFKTKFTSILVLNLCGNQLDDLPKNFASSVPNLETLQLSRNFFVEIPKEVRNLSQLKKLDFSKNGIKEINSMKGVLREGLQSLDLSGNLLSCFPPAIADCQSLTYLDVSRNSFSSTPTSKRRFSLKSQPTTFPKLDNSPLCQSLKTLSISDCNLNSLPIDDFLMKLTSLTTLDASKNPLRNINYVVKKIFIEGEDVRKSVEEELLPNLQELNLSYCKLTTVSSQFLTASEMLHTLNLAHNDLSSFILVPSISLGTGGLKSPAIPVNSSMLVIDKSERLGRLTYLNLSHNRIGNISDNIFKQLNKLQYLKLSYQDSTFDFNAFFDRVSMEDLYDLNILGLAGLRLEKKVPNGLNRRMEVINLSYNELTHIPEQIFDMKNLRVLKLAANNISEFDQARMAELRSLQRISLRYNCMTEFPRIFLQMKLQDVNLEHNFEIKIDDEIEAWKKNNNVKFARTFTVPNQILENLYLGNAQTAQNPHYLRKIGITHILTVAAKLPPLFPTKFQYKVIEIEDTNDDFLKKYFIECIEFIENATKGGGNVLVHCKAGVSRSATIVIAFIMKTKNMSVVDAMEFVKERRNQICLNTSFMRQLEQFSKELTKG